MVTNHLLNLIKVTTRAGLVLLSINLITAIQIIRDYIESPKTERINGSYQYKTPAYHYKKPGEDLIVTVNATNNEYVSVRNASDSQLEKMDVDGNIGLDSRPDMVLLLRLRGGPR